MCYLCYRGISPISNVYKCFNTKIAIRIINYKTKNCFIIEKFSIAAYLSGKICFFGRKKMKMYKVQQLYWTQMLIYVKKGEKSLIALWQIWESQWIWFGTSRSTHKERLLCKWWKPAKTILRHIIQKNSIPDSFFLWNPSFSLSSSPNRSDEIDESGIFQTHSCQIFISASKRWCSNAKIQRDKWAAKLHWLSSTISNRLKWRGETAGIQTLLLIVFKHSIMAVRTHALTVSINDSQFKGENDDLLKSLWISCIQSQNTTQYSVNNKELVNI